MNPIKEIERTTQDRYPIALHATLQFTFYTLISPIAPEKILLKEADITLWNAGIMEEKEIVKETKKAEETAELRKRDSIRNKIASSLIQEIRLAARSPIEENCAPGHRLKIIADTYKGLIRKDLATKTAQIKALLNDLGKPDPTADLAFLKLDLLVPLLRTANENFDSLYIKRLNFDVALKNLPSATSIRKKNDKMTYAIFRHIEAAYITAASDNDRKLISDLIDRINAALRKIKTIYTQSMAQKRAAAERKRRQEDDDTLIPIADSRMPIDAANEATEMADLDMDSDTQTT